MKRTIIFILTSLLLISSMTACASKDNTEENNSVESRVLYSEEKTAEESDETDEAATDETDTAVKEENDKSSDTSKKSVTATSSASSKKVASSKKTAASTSSAASQKTVSSVSTAASAVNSAPVQSSVGTTSVMPSQFNVSSMAPTGANIISGGNYREVPPTVSSKASETETQTTDTDTSIENTEEPTAAGSFNDSDFTAFFAAGAVNFGDDIDSVKIILGEPIDIQSAPNAKIPDQFDKTFVFSNCSIKTNPNEDGTKDYVVSIVINGGDYTTSKGARLGTTSDELISIYGSSISDDSSVRKYVMGDKTLAFYIENDVVAEIDYIWDN